MGIIKKDGRCLIKGLRTEKNGAKRLIKGFPNNTTTSLKYFLLSITITSVVADGALTSINQTCTVAWISAVMCILLGSAVTK